MVLCLVSYCPSVSERLGGNQPDSWYKANHWARTTAIACFVLVALVAIVNWTRRYVEYRPRKTTAFLRGLGYRHVAFIDLSLGFVLTLTTLFLALLVWCLQMQPYYRRGVEWGNSPLGIRAGYIAQGLIPFVFVMGSRINPLAWIARVEASRWMLWHQYGARVLLFFSLLHTFVLMYAPYRQGGMAWVTAYWNKMNLWKNFFNDMGLLLNGTVALVALGWIVFSSFAKLRNWNYEFFVIQHVLSVTLFIMSLWPHLKMGMPDCIYYAYASIAIWIFSVVVRIAWESVEMAGVGKWKGTAMVEGFGGGDVRGIGGVTKLLVETKRGGWDVGTYVYLRVPSINPFQSHPFTIASAPPTDPKTPSPLTLLISTRSGITKRITNAAVNYPHKPIPVVIQGPFGGLGERLERFDKILVICGGVGAAFGWPIVSKFGKEGKVKMVWSARNLDSLKWFEDDTTVNRSSIQLHLTSSPSQIPEKSTESDTEVDCCGSTANSTLNGTDTPMSDIGEEKRLHQRSTHQRATSDYAVPSSCCAPLPMLDSVDTPMSTIGEEKRLQSSSVPSNVDVRTGRCDVRSTVRDYAECMGEGEKLAVIVCGPVSMLAETANAVSSLQWDIVRGRTGLGEVWMHKERFGW
ncbi:hypothetical protein L202_02635 [Cryptococcus amylolentus CBS 6039]|uniref:FAD-binding FR-type domain-containing protein n=1 Tax=Cryptococcus amylolentus CBS 6039 TaxID=1295533 RepID=A0A1E3HVN9_9TREE|nr:hypothetical protein L202_02635 [Cryptococcus amylolentus CBS 6039]ODN80384.1 hypothetical protein L202_02635 [Cryptococcus amylolentus CBS 6039]